MDTGNRMSRASRKDYLQRIYPRYQKASRPKRQRILDEFCANCSYHHSVPQRSPSSVVESIQQYHLDASKKNRPVHPGLVPLPSTLPPQGRSSLGSMLPLDKSRVFTLLSTASSYVWNGPWTLASATTRGLKLNHFGRVEAERVKSSREKEGTAV
jgi:hypothetical protein